MPGWALPLDENYLAGNDAPGSFGDEGDGWTPEGATSGEDLSAMDAWQGQVANLAEPDGGFTVDPVTGESIVHGLSVGGQCQSSITPAEPCCSRYSTSASVLSTLRQFLEPTPASVPRRRQMT